MIMNRVISFINSGLILILNNWFLLIKKKNYELFYCDTSKDAAIKTLNNTITEHHSFNPLMPMSSKWGSLTKILILLLEGIIKNVSYERRAYESVDEKSLS